MENAIVIKGRLVGPTRVELNEPAPGPLGEVEVIVRTAQNGGARPTENIFDFLHRVPPGKRTREEIDRQICDERADWGQRE